MKTKLALTTAIAALCFAASVSAHHSFATHYDGANIVEISGVLSEVKMRSPHSFFEVDVTNENGEVETWEVEAHAVPLLRRLGINRDTMKVGDQVTIRGPRSRRPEKLLLFGAQINTGSGESFEMLDSIRRAPEEKITDKREGVTGVDRLTGKWLTFITGQVVADSPMPLTDAGLQARREFDLRKNSSSDCVPPNLPSLLMIPYIYDITRSGDTVNIFHEYSKIRRPVILGAKVGNITDPQYGGRIGRYEDGALIIESTAFPAMAAGLASGWDPNGNGADIPSSENKKLIERYTVNEDGSQMTLRYTVSDPVYLTEPYTAEIPFYRLPDDEPIQDFTCDAEIASRSTSNAAVLEN